MLQAVIFDFDGVIADSEPIHCRAFLEVLPQFGFPLTEDMYYRDYLGYTDADALDVLSRDLKVPIDEATRRRALELKSRRFEELIQNEKPIISGVPAFVRMLHSNRIPLGICSGALRSDIDLILEGSELQGVFDVVVSADDVTKGKPDPQGFVLTLHRLSDTVGRSIPAESCVVIEDSLWGLQAAKTAGMKRIAVTHTYPSGQLAPQADRVVNSLGELTLSDLHSLCVQ
ncbi:MAG: HAD family phosphatase [Phycisphaerae bacterium]|nr:HAD family phosphatase [Phycisphaerae bacterium]